MVVDLYCTMRQAIKSYALSLSTCFGKGNTREQDCFSQLVAVHGDNTPRNNFQFAISMVVDIVHTTHPSMKSSHSL